MTHDPIVRCVDPVCGLVQHQLYRVIGVKMHPVSGQTLQIVREHPSGNMPVPSDPKFGYLRSRFDSLTYSGSPA